MSTAKTTGISAAVAALAVAGTMLLSGEAPAGAGVSADGRVPVRATYAVPKGKKAIVKVYIGGKLKGADTLICQSDSMKLYLKSQLIKSK